MAHSSVRSLITKPELALRIWQGKKESGKKDSFDEGMSLNGGKDDEGGQLRGGE